MPIITTMIWVAVLLLLCNGQAFANNRFSANEEDYQEDAPDYGAQVRPQQVLLPIPKQLELAPFVMYPNGNKLKVADDGKRRGGSRPQNMLNGGLPNGGLGQRTGQVDVIAGIRQLNVTHRPDASWPDARIKTGGVSGVSLDRQGHVVVFHRADRVWTERTFDLKNVFLEKNLGAIPSNTILAIDRKTGQLAYEFGKDLFYMPHGITVDHEDNVWLTDVALHQVMKLNRNKGDGDSPLMVLGNKFSPGNGRTNFCKPTSVAVLPSGDFFVADGYCNARIIKFNKSGDRILEWGKNAFTGRALSIAPVNYLAIPHALTLALDKGLLCVADRENGRVQCFQHSDGTFHSQYHSPLIGDRLFSVAYAPADGGQLFVVNGPPLELNVRMEVKGFVFNMSSGNVTAVFPGDGTNYTNPHDLAVSEDGEEIYVAEYEPYQVHKLVSLVRKGDKASGSAGLGGASGSGASGLRSVLIVALVVLLGVMVAGGAWVVVRQRKRGSGGLRTIYEPKRVKGRRRLAWDLNKGELKLGSLLDGHRGAGRRHRFPSTSRGKFRQLGQESEDEEATSMLSRQSSIDEEGEDQMA